MALPAEATTPRGRKLSIQNDIPLFMAVRWWRRFSNVIIALMSDACGMWHNDIMLTDVDGIDVFVADDHI